MTKLPIPVEIDDDEESRRHQEELAIRNDLRISNIEWAVLAVAHATSLDRMHSLAEMFKYDSSEKVEYTLDRSAYVDLKRAWASKYIAMGGRLKSKEASHPDESINQTLYGLTYDPQSKQRTRNEKDIAGVPAVRTPSGEGVCGEDW